METHKIQENLKKPGHLLNNIVFFLFGIFITTTIFAIIIQLLGPTGLWVGLLLNIGLIFCGFYYVEKSSFLRKVTWGMLSILVIGTVAFFVGLQVLNNLWSDI